MKTVFEMVSQEALPLVRSLASKDMMASGFSQKLVADKLGLTQPAISQYKSNRRGMSSTIPKNSESYHDIKRISQSIAKGKITIDQATMQIFDICRKLAETGAR